MPGAIGEPRQADDDVVYVQFGSTNETATRGDVLAFSGTSIIAVSTGNPAVAYPYSAIGIAMAQNPFYDQLGSASAHGKLPVGRRGIFRVSAVTGNYSAGLFAFPVATGSGIVGQTGATGQAALWSATAVVSRNVAAAFAVLASSGSASAYAITPNSAIAQIVRVVASGATGQWDVVLIDARAMNAPLTN